MMLSTEIEVRKSKIDGRGVFALRDFKPGEIVIAWDTSNTLSDDEYERLPEEQRKYVVRHKGAWLYMLEPGRYVNHSCDPNAIPLNGADVAIREIRAGDEVTSDYRPVMPVGERMDCHCGAANCMGYIVGTAV
jgi:SET domain-containing protein